MKRFVSIQIIVLGLVCGAHPAAAQAVEEVKLELTSIEAEDGVRARGTLYWIPSKRPTTVLVSMHPNGDNQRHFPLRPAAERGFAGYGIVSRWQGKHGIHEELLLDMAAAIRWLKKERGFEHVVLVGHSGGGSLSAYYQSQAETAPPNRFKETPAGDPPNLNTIEMIPADAVAILNANEGEGLHLTHHLDPSIVDESDPFSLDPSLDMFNPANGFRMPPESSRYSEEFVKRFRDAQWARAERLTTIARGHIEEQNLYRRLLALPGFEGLLLERRFEIERRAEHLPIMVIYRSEADLDYTDQVSCPSHREYGSNRSRRLDVFNYGPRARFRTARPDVFLSTLSGPASQARLHENIKKVTIPTLVLIGTADRGTYVWTQEKTYECAAAQDKTVVKIEGGDHGFRPSGPKAGDGQQLERTIDALLGWVEARFPETAARADEPPALVIRGVRLIDGTGAPAREGVTVIVEGERIATIGVAGRTEIPAGAQVVDAAGKTLMPGLIDTHVHFRDYVAELFLAHGVTTVRDAGNPTEWILALRRLQAAGEMPGPRILAVGNIIDAPPPMRGHHIGVETPEEAREATRRLIEAGVDGIKVYVKMTPELLRPVVEVAHAANRRVLGHVTMSARDAARASIDALEHASGIAIAIARDPALVQEIPEHHGVLGWRFMDEAKADELVRLLVDRQVAVVPALATWARGAPRRPALRAEAAAVVTHPELVYLPEFVTTHINRLAADGYSEAERRDLEADYYALKDFLGRFRRAGGTVVVGTDGGGLPGLSVHHELQLLVDMGFSPLEAIRAATGAAAELLQADELGSVAPGKIADLVLLDGNPLESIEDTKKIVMVIQRGRIADARFHRDYRIPIPRPPVRGSRP